ncbi:WAS/WASL interacting protein family member 2 [Trichostrongylus colubriformis]|uniref:WAS/WASL interacting protein family member 2 n=1 Tax=Trichostrongylus colubriformis TaxID=6319 RepID=A0AAN8FD70_TRICO
MPPPPPPPPPPPTALLSSSSSASAPSLKKPVALLADIQKGTKLRKVTTNDRSAPLVTGKPSSVSSGTPSITNQLEREPKPGSGGRTYGGGGAPIGGLFANGLPSKPSENKIRRANTSVTPAAASPPPPPPMPSSVELGLFKDFSSRESTPARAPLARPAVPPPSRPSAPPPPPPTARTNGSYTSDPPPPPAVPPVTSALSNRYVGRLSHLCYSRPPLDFADLHFLRLSGVALSQTILQPEIFTAVTSRTKPRNRILKDRKA